MHWGRTGAQPAQLCITAADGELRFTYSRRVESESSVEAELCVRTTWTQCNSGGRRPWFLCPRRGCGRRVAILYGDRDFGCRVCRRLTYKTQRVPPESRSLERGTDHLWSRRQDLRAAWDCLHPVDPGILTGCAHRYAGSSVYVSPERVIP